MSQQYHSNLSCKMMLAYFKNLLYVGIFWRLRHMNPQFFVPWANAIQANSIVNTLTQALVEAPKPL